MLQKGGKYSSTVSGDIVFGLKYSTVDPYFMPSPSPG
jgi:hypothetical protein